MATLQLGKTLGQGAFGIVRVAEYGGEKVAVKMLKSFDADNHNLTDAEKAAFAQEAELMRALPPHRNVIRLIGVVTKTQPNCIVTAFAQNGSLEAYLKSNRGKLSPTQRLTMCIDAANGVMHLHKHKLVHRDIAARNFLIDARGTILITDFGMTRAVVSDSGTTRARTGPLRYMPPESLQKQEYSTASDVWAFGVLMWEVESGAATPYGHLTLPQTAMQVVMEGLRLEEPENCYPGLFDVMLRCWRTEVSDRATLDQILTELLRLSDNRRAEYWVPRLE
jgi:serine/threonine protein kinase